MIKKLQFIYLLLIPILAFNAYNTVQNSKRDVRVMVISKNTQDKLHKHKSHITIDGYNRNLLVKNDVYGFAEITVGLNTYMLAKEGEYLTFNLTQGDIEGYFRYKKFDESFIDKYLLQILLILVFTGFVHLILWDLSKGFKDEQ